MSGPGLQATQVVGGLVPPALFGRIQAGELNDGLSATSYHLTGRETIRDAVNRSWAYLRGRWEDWRQAEHRPGDQTGTGMARSMWLSKLFEQLGYGQLQPTRGALQVDDTDFPVSHTWQHVPIHLLGSGVDLDHRNPGVVGAARAPQAMVQDLLNRSEEHLWAFVSNGLRLRVLRDSTSLAGSAYIEFDLEEIFDGLLFDEFLLLWQVCHVSRVEKRGGIDASANDCWLEAWRDDVRASGTRALRELRFGVKDALEALGSGFLTHPDNTTLRAALRDGVLSREDYHRALLRLVYRLLFLSVVEERGLLHPENTDPVIKQRYADYFSVGRLRRLSRIRSGGPHADLWESLRLVLGALGGKGLDALGLPALAGLFDPADKPIDGSTGTQDVLGQAALANQDLLSAMYALGWIRFQGERIQPVDYRNLDAEELGSIYEQLLELVPRVDLDASEFTLESVAGNERKTTGSYYTPSSLVSALLDSTLDPLLTEARKKATNAQEWETNLLALTVCDPACGSGHFLVAAARRIARELAEARSGEDEPTPKEIQHALRDVVGHCIYGVDVNPMAAELAKVSLWLEAIQPGKALGFLDPRIRVGNSLLGTTPALVAQGIPDDAFKALEGDDKTLVRELKKRNKVERTGHGTLQFSTVSGSNVELAEHRDPLLQLRDDADEVRSQAKQWTDYATGDDLLIRQRIQADAWCAAFVWKLSKGCPEVPTSVMVENARSEVDMIPPDTRSEIDRLAEQYKFFHWHLEFPEIFPVPNDGPIGPEGWNGGFSCLLGNPPWERVKLQDQEFFAARDPEIATAPNKAARKKLINALLDGDSPSGKALHTAYLEAKRQAEGESHLLRATGRFTLTGRGDVNTYAVFAETFRTVTGPQGRAGIIVPTGIATDATTQYFFKELVSSHTLVSLYDFENEEKVFPSVHHSFRFCLLTGSGRSAPQEKIWLAFRLRQPDQVQERRFVLTPEEILLLNPNTGTCPVFRGRRDMEITLGIYKRVPVLARENVPNNKDNPWGISLTTMFHMSGDSHLFQTREKLEANGWILDGNVFTKGDERMLPLYEAKLLHHYDHRWATYGSESEVHDLTVEDKQEPDTLVMPRYWVPENDVPTDRKDSKGNTIYEAGVATRLTNQDWAREWLLGWRDICRVSDERTMINSILPRAAAGHPFPNILFEQPQQALLLSAQLSSFVFDYVTRQKIGGTHLTYSYVMQLPVLTPKQVGSYQEFCISRHLELTYTAQDMTPFARDFGDTGSPFVWDEERRALLRAELDTLFFRLYGIDRDDVDYIMEMFPVVKRRDMAKHNEYRTKRLILEIYDRMAEADRTGEPYQTILDPPPGEGPRHPAPVLAKGV